MNYYTWRGRDAGGMADVVPWCLDIPMLEAYISGSDDPYMKITQYNAFKSTQNSCFMRICVSIAKKWQYIHTYSNSDCEKKRWSHPEISLAVAFGKQLMQMREGLQHKNQKCM